MLVSRRRAIKTIPLVFGSQHTHSYSSPMNINYGDEEEGEGDYGEESAELEKFSDLDVEDIEEDVEEEMEEEYEEEQDYSQEDDEEEINPNLLLEPFQVPSKMSP